MAQEVEAAEVDDNAALTELSWMLDVEGQNELVAALQARAKLQKKIEEHLRAIVANPMVDPELRQIRREAVQQLGRHTTDQNIRTLICSIDLIAPPLVVSSEFAFGEIELFYPSTHELIANMGRSVIPLSIDEVAHGRLGWELNDTLDTKLELLAYTLLSIQRNSDQGPQVTISDEMRRKLVGRVRAGSTRGSRVDRAIIDRFIELIETVEPSIYRFPSLYDERKYRLPRESRILAVHSETGKLNFKPMSAYIKALGKEHYPK
jgi:hypothetical protein